MIGARLKAFGRDRRGASALEFALVATPLIGFVLGVLQLGVYYMTQTALDSAVLQTAEGLRVNFAPGSVISTPSLSTLKSTVVANAGALINNDANFNVDLQPLSALSTTATPISGVISVPSSTSVLALRAQAGALSFFPVSGTTLMVRSSAILRAGT